jgi:hypothetical protein
VTEAKWLGANDPTPMLEFLRGTGRASDRKLRLFIVACYSWTCTFEHADPRRELLRVFELWADGLVSREAVVAAREGITSDDWEFDSATRLEDAYLAARAAIHDSALALAQHAAYGEAAEGRDVVAMENEWQEWGRAAVRQQVLCLHDLFGPLPFRPVAVEDGWLSWNNGTVRRLAEAAYQDRLLPQGMLDPDRLAVLGDALEEAGCGEVALLDHLRGPGPHVRGCWAVDLLSGRE